MTEQTMGGAVASGGRVLPGRRAFVTGAGGFLGSHLVRALVSAGCQVTALVRPDTNLIRLRDMLHAITVVYGDVASPLSMAAVEASHATDLVVHLAAAGTDQRTHDLRTLMEVNVYGTLQVLELARRGNAKRVIYAESCAEYGSGSRLTEHHPLAPTSSYGISKAAGWMAAHADARSGPCSVVSLRIFSPFGPCEHPRRLVPYTILSALQGKDVRLTPGEQTRDFIFVRDVIEAFLLAAITPNLTGETFNVCTGQETRVIDLVRLLLRLMGDPVKPLPGALPYSPGEPQRISGDSRKAHDLLGWRARVSLEDGLRETIRWFTRHRDDVLATESAKVT